MPNEESIIDLAMAENGLIRDEILEIERTVVKDHLKSEVCGILELPFFLAHKASNGSLTLILRLDSQHLDYPKGFWGNPPLLKDLAKFFTDYFNPRVPVLHSHIALAPGAAGCIDALLFNICDPHDGVLIPAPYWSIESHANILPSKLLSKHGW